MMLKHLQALLRILCIFITVWMCKLNASTQDAEQPEDAADPALGQDQRGPAAGARGEGQVGGSSEVDLINSNKNG